MEFLARLTEAKIPVLIVDTLRTKAEHEDNLTRGVSWASVSNHLDGREYRNTVPGSDAIDVAPFEIFQLHGGDKLQWNPSDPVWEQIAVIGESVGLVAGARWRNHPDFGHFEHRDARDGLTRAAGVASA